MKYLQKMKIFLSAVICLFIFSQNDYSQTYSFRNYGAENNIPDGYVYTFDQSDDGFLWVGTGKGLTRFDGYDFFNVIYPDSSTLRIANRSLKDKSGKIWFGCNDGTVYFTKNNRLVQVNLNNESSIFDIVEGPDGLIYVIPQGKAIFSIDPENPAKVNEYQVPGEPIMSSAAFANDRELLIGTQDNIMICSLTSDGVAVSGVVEGFDYSTVTAIMPAGNGSDFIVGTDGNGLFRLKITGTGNTLSRFPDHPEFNSLSIQSLFKGGDNNVLIATFGDGAIQLGFPDSFETIASVRKYRQNTGLLSDDVKSVFQDSEGNYWFGTFGQGISMLTSYAFGYYLPGKDPLMNNIIYVSAYGDKYILGTPAGFHLFDALRGKSVSFTGLTKLAGNTEITSYLFTGGDLWIGTGGKGLYVRTRSGNVRKVYQSGDTGSDFINDIEIGNDRIWLATTNGVVILDKNTGKEEAKFNINNGLPHNSINRIMVSPDGKVYVGTESDRLYYFDKDLGIHQLEGVMYGSTLNKIQSFAESRGGAIWAATKSNGVFRFQNDSVVAITRSNDLMSNYCYSIFADSEDNIWIGHERGFSRYNLRKGSMRVYGADFVRGGVCNTGGMYESPDHKIFIGTTDGLIIYDMLKDKKEETPPFTNINYITINDVRDDYRSSINLPYNKKYVVRINYIGINFSDPDKVYYSTYMENWDNTWSKLTTSREVSYSLRDGRYKFNLLSVNEDGLSREEAVSFDLFIRQPFWRSWWFILLAITATAGGVIVIVRQREKAQKKIQDYLEKELDARTRVVVQQKAEIELQNIEITDSINYAKRIQSSILPDITRLKESFRDAFILFEPRDIVSGDFYWFDKYDDEKFIVVCADSCR